MIYAMTESPPLCSRCGVQKGSASSFRRQLCETCATKLKANRQVRSSIVHTALLLSGVYVTVTDREGVVAFLLFVFAFFDLIGFVTSLVHEAAHAVSGRAVGFRIREISIGIGPRLGSLTLGGMKLVLRLYPLGGHTAYLPRGRATRARAIVVTAAGPLSHIPLAWLADQILSADPGWQPYAPFAVRYILLMGLINLIPFRGVDGHAILKFLVMPDAEVAGLLKTASAMEVAIELQAVEQGLAAPSESHREAFLEHLSHPNISDRDRAISLNNLAVIDLALEDPKWLHEADRASAEAMQLPTDIPAIRNTRGAVLIGLGHDEQGIALMEPTLESIPFERRGASHGNLALAYARTGMLFEARRHIAAAHSTGLSTSSLEAAEQLAGPLEAEVAREYLDGRSPDEAAAMVRDDARALASTIGHILLRHIEKTGEDADLRAMAETLV
jgi:Zn-dependent protease